MAVINIKPKDVVIPFDVMVMLGYKLENAELERFNKLLEKKENENRDKEKEK